MNAKPRSFSVLTYLFIFVASPGLLHGQEPAAEPTENQQAAPRDETAASDLIRADKALIGPGENGRHQRGRSGKGGF